MYQPLKGEPLNALHGAYQIFAVASNSLRKHRYSYGICSALHSAHHKHGVGSSNAYMIAFRVMKDFRPMSYESDYREGFWWQPPSNRDKASYQARQNALAMSQAIVLDAIHAKTKVL